MPTPTRRRGAEAIADMVIAAVREQLGFKLEMQQAPLDIMVVDRAEEAVGELMWSGLGNS